jgi:dephospho-CoA kinase
MYVGITGTMGSGKGEVARILRKHGFVHYSFGDFLRQELDKQGIEHTIAATTEFANKLRKEHGPGYIAELMLRQFQAKPPKHAVFESLRSPAELAVLKRIPHFILISVDAPREQRFERIKHRGRRDGINSFEEFCEQEDRQLEGSLHEQQILNVMDAADIKVVNIGNLEELENQIREELNI